MVLEQLSVSLRWLSLSPNNIHKTAFLEFSQLFGTLLTLLF